MCMPIASSARQLPNFSWTTKDGKKKLNAPFEFRLFWFFPNLTSMSPTKKTIDVQLLVRNQPNAGGP